MSKPDFYIRFGVHKEREVLNEMREYISGLCIPCHILSYSQDPTIAAIKYVDKPYFIDPMTYIYAFDDFSKYLAKKENKEGEKEIKFKPSIQKLTIDLKLVDFFEDSGYQKLAPQNFDDVMVRALAESSMRLQLNKANDGKETAFKRYSELLDLAEGKEVESEVSNDISPDFLVSPYFYFKGANDPWLKTNIDLFNASKMANETDKEVVPFLMTDTDALNESLIDSFDANKFILWLTDFNPKYDSSTDAQLNKLRKVKEFIVLAGEKDKTVIDMYGSYYMLLLGKLGGLSGICNGVLHGESKTKDVTIGGGAPPVRYYIRKLHDFLLIPEAISVLTDSDGSSLLDNDCHECKVMIDGDAENLNRFENNHYLAQKHFMHARVCEIEDLESTDLDEVLVELEKDVATFKDSVEGLVKKTVSNFLTNWIKVLRE